MAELEGLIEKTQEGVNAIGKELEVLAQREAALQRETTDDPQLHSALRRDLPTRAVRWARLSPPISLRWLKRSPQHDERAAS